MFKTFMRATTFAAVAALLIAVSTGGASAVTVTFSNGGGDGMGHDLGSGAFDIAVQMNSNDDKSPNKTSSWSGILGADVLIIGRWAYRSNDKRDSSFDPLGYYVGSTYHSLSDSLSPSGLQNGKFRFKVAANTVFSWVLDSTDGQKGRSAAAIFARVKTVEAATVPLPASGLLLLGAMAGLAALRRRKT